MDSLSKLVLKSPFRPFLFEIYLGLVSIIIGLLGHSIYLIGGAKDYAITFLIALILISSAPVILGISYFILGIIVLVSILRLSREDIRGKDLFSHRLIFQLSIFVLGLLGMIWILNWDMAWYLKICYSGMLFSISIISNYSLSTSKRITISLFFKLIGFILLSTLIASFWLFVASYRL